MNKEECNAEGRCLRLCNAGRITGKLREMAVLMGDLMVVVRDYGVQGMIV